ncbi:putative metal-binding motif-containing protein [Patescibacteria group bacterium]|nr:putative metal-binding motif-containing protein [Patescibacteria group bacterium]
MKKFNVSAIVFVSVSAIVAIGCVADPKPLQCDGDECGSGGSGATGNSGGAGATAGSGGSGASAPDCDKDDDGFVCDSAACGGDDCDDDNANVNPDAVEICNNGIDDDCDGDIDDDDASCVGDDADDDGYVDHHDGGDDCDDSDADVHPGAAEICNGIDDDCDGAVDEGDVCGSSGGTSFDGDACNGTVTYVVTAAGALAESLRLEGDTVAYNVQAADDDCPNGVCTVDDWTIIPPGEQYSSTASWTFVGCADKSVRFNVRGWSSQPVTGAPNNDAYACTLYWVSGLSPEVVVKRGGVVVSYQDDLVNGAPNGDGRNCQVNGH